MAMTARRRQCIAMAMIAMLSVAEAHRVQETIRMMENYNYTDSDDNAVAVFSPSSDLTHRIATANDAVDKIQNGDGFWGIEYCMISCPRLWISVAYNQWKMRSAAKALIDQSFGTNGHPLTALPDVDNENEKPLATSFKGVMRKAVWTFVKAVDSSIVQRVLLTVLMAPLGLFRTVTGMSPLGLCFLKSAWDDIHRHDPETYQQKSTRWWAGMLSGCSNTSSDAPFDSEPQIAGIIDSMVLALAKPEGLGVEDDDAKWAGQATHAQCVDKLSRTGEWLKRELSIQKGIITWRSTEECGSSLLGRMRGKLGHSKSFAMQFLSTPSVGDTDLVKLFVRAADGHNCTMMRNAHREFEFCAEEGADMADAKRVIDQHVSLLGSDRALLGTASKVDRLVAAASIQDDAEEEQARLKDEDDATGETTVRDQELERLGQVPEDLQGEEAAVARNILSQVKEASSLIATGQDVANATAMLQEAFAGAHMNQHLRAVMRGEISHGLSNELLAAGAAAGSGSAVTTTELLIILLICGGGFFCIGFAIGMASSLQESGHADTFQSLTQNSTRPVFPHQIIAPLA